MIWFSDSQFVFYKKQNEFQKGMQFTNCISEMKIEFQEMPNEFQNHEMIFVNSISENVYLSCLHCFWEALLLITTLLLGGIKSRPIGKNRYTYIPRWTSQTSLFLKYSSPYLEIICHFRKYNLWFRKNKFSFWNSNYLFWNISHASEIQLTNSEI